MAVFKPKNSKNYHYRYMLNGKIFTGSTRTTNKVQAEKFEHQHKDQSYRSAILGELPSITLKDALQNFLDTKRKLASHLFYLSRVKKILSNVYDRAGKKHSKRCFGFSPDTKLDEIKEKDIQRLVVEREKEGMGPMTILQELTVWNQTIRLAKRMGFKIPDISLSDIRKENNIKPPKGRLRYLSIDEEERLLQELNPATSSDVISTPAIWRTRQDTHDIVILLLDLGARHTEVSHLKWSKIDMLERTILLYRPKVQNQSVLHMTDRVYEVLLRRFNEKDRGEFVFTDSTGKGVRKYTPTALNSAFCRSGIEDATFHTLRHTFCSRMVQAGLPLADIQQIVGHATIQMTLKYAHLAPLQSSSRAIQLLNAINNRKALPSSVM